MLIKNDTIAAIATAPGDSGIGIVRVSGEKSIEIVDSIFKNKKGNTVLNKAKSHTIHYGYIIKYANINNIENNDNKNIIKKNIDYINNNININIKNDNKNYIDQKKFEDSNNEKNNENSKDKDLSKDNIIDEVLVSVFRAPKSYTAEDTVEINCHGGSLIVKKVLETVIQAGARLAEPGEFTKRAFFNGRIDLSEAEAVMDLIHSKNELARKTSFGQLRGDLSKKITSLRKKLIYEIAFIESALDDPEHISLEGYPEKLDEKLTEIMSEIQHLLDTAENGRMVKEGISTVIVGKPNAGKSSLLNMILGQDRAIVTEIAGTTRDVLEESFRFRDIHLNIIDTAGIRDTQDIVEKIGVDRAKQYAKDADLILYVIDSSVELDENDREILSFIRDKKVIFLLNKSDLEAKVTEEELIRNYFSITGDSEDFTKEFSVIYTSAVQGKGLDELENAIENLLFTGAIKNNDEVMITNMRHKEALSHALQSLKLVKKSIADGMPEDFYTIDLMEAYASLGAILGEEVGDDLVEEIFSKFCMGK